MGVTDGFMTPFGLGNLLKVFFLLKEDFFWIKEERERRFDNTAPFKESKVICMHKASGQRVKWLYRTSHPTEWWMDSYPCFSADYAYNEMINCEKHVSFLIFLLLIGNQNEGTWWLECSSRDRVQHAIYV